MTMTAVNFVENNVVSKSEMYFNSFVCFSSKANIAPWYEKSI